MNNQQLQFGQPVPPHTVYVTFTAEVFPQTVDALISLFSQLHMQGTKKAVLMISSPGGSTMHGFALYNYMKSLPIEFHTHNMGGVNSIANVIFQAGSRRTSAKNSTFMFHGVAVGIPQATKMELKDVREKLDAILADQQRIASVLLETTKLNASTVENLFLESTTKDANFAIEHGIIDEICDIQIPDDATVLSLAFNRQ